LRAVNASKCNAESAEGLAYSALHTLAGFGGRRRGEGNFEGKEEREREGEGGQTPEQKF